MISREHSMFTAVRLFYTPKGGSPCKRLALHLEWSLKYWAYPLARSATGSVWVSLSRIALQGAGVFLSPGTLNQWLNGYAMQNISGPPKIANRLPHFDAIPKWIRVSGRLNKLRGSDVKVLIVLAGWADWKKRECNPTQDTIAREAGISKSSIGSIVDRLALAEIIQKDRRGNRMGYRIKFQEPDWWTEQGRPWLGKAPRKSVYLRRTDGGRLAGSFKRSTSINSEASCAEKIETSGTDKIGIGLKAGNGSW